MFFPFVKFAVTSIDESAASEYRLKCLDYVKHSITDGAGPAFKSRQIESVPHPVAYLGESQLYESDILMFSGHGWLTDNCISFVFEAIQSKLSDSDKSRVEFISPPAVELIAHFPPETLREVFHDRDFDKAQLFFLPICDGDGRRAGSGTHWSLLVVLKESYAKYFDSNGGDGCISKAKTVLSNLCTGFAMDKMHCVATPCSRQRNAGDCGIYVLLYCETILHRFLISEGGQFELGTIVSDVV